MDDTTSVPFGLDDHRVLDVVRVAGRVVRVVIETVEREGACPACGVLSTRVRDRPLVRLRDLPAGGQRVQLWCRRRRLCCQEPACPRLSFTQVSAQVPARSRITARRRRALAEAIAGSNRAVADVAVKHGVSWHTAHRALVAAAARWLPEPVPTRVLGIDETRTRTVRWILDQAAGRRVWRRSDPWMTSFVDADPTRAGLAPGRSGSCGPGAPSRARGSGTRSSWSSSTPRRRTSRASARRCRGRGSPSTSGTWSGSPATCSPRSGSGSPVSSTGTGTLEQPVWVHRRILLTAGDRLSSRQLARLRAVLASDDPTGDIGAAWAVKERLRMLLVEADPARISDGPRGPHPERDPRPHRGLQQDRQAEPSGSPAAFATWTTTGGASCPTSRSPNATSGSSMDEAAPLKCEEPS